MSAANVHGTAVVGMQLAVGDAVWISVTGGFVAVVLLAVVTVALVMRRELRAKLGTMEVTLGSVDRAVNQRPRGSTTISQDVTRIKNRLEALDEIPRKLDELTVVVRDLAGRVVVLEHPGTGGTSADAPDV